MQRPSHGQLALLGTVAVGVGGRAIAKAFATRRHRGVHQLKSAHLPLSSISSASSAEPKIPLLDSSWQPDIFSGVLLVVFVVGAVMAGNSALIAKGENAIPEYIIRGSAGGIASSAAAVVAGLRLVLRLEGRATKSLLEAHHLAAGLKDLKASVQDARTEVKEGRNDVKAELKSEIRGVKSKMDEKFDKMDKKFDQLCDSIDRRLDRSDKKFDSFCNRVEGSIRGRHGSDEVQCVPPKHKIIYKKR